MFLATIRTGHTDEKRIPFRFDERELRAIRQALKRHKRLTARIKAVAKDFLHHGGARQVVALRKLTRQACRGVP